MSSKMFFDNINNHLDMIFTEEELDIEEHLSIRDDEDDSNLPMSFPTFKGVMNGNPYTKFFKEHEEEKYNVFHLLLGMFNMNDSVKTAVKKFYCLEILEYYISNGFQFNIKSEQMSMNKCEIISLFYISHILQEQNYESSDLPEINTTTGEILDEGVAEFVITKEMIWKLNHIDTYCKNYLRKQKESVDKQTNKEKEKVLTLKKKAIINNVLNPIHSVDMYIKKKYFDLIYDDLFGHIDTSELTNKRSHRNDLKRKFMKEDPFDKETKKIDYTLHAFCVFFNQRVDKILTC